MSTKVPHLDLSDIATPGGEQRGDYPVTSSARSDRSDVPQGLAECLLAAICARCSHMFDTDDHHPRLLPCLHVVCFSCLASIAAESLTCPQCRTRHEMWDDDVTSLPRDSTKQELLELMRLRNEPQETKCDFCDEGAMATYRCHDCGEYLCDECLNFHKRYKRYKKHDVVSIENLKAQSNRDDFLLPVPHCTIPDHVTEFLTLYCTDAGCRRAVCSKCALADIAAGHKVVELDDVYNTMVTSLKSDYHDLDYLYKGAETGVALIQEGIVGVRTMAKEATAKVTLAYNELMTALQKQKEKLLSQIKFEEARKLDVLEEQEETLQHFKQAIEDGRSYMNEAILHTNRPAFLEIAPFIQEQFTKLKQTTLDKGVNVNTVIEFNPSKLPDDLDLGFVSSTRAYAPNTKIFAPKYVAPGDVVSVLIQLHDRHGEAITDEESRMEVCLIDKKGKVLTAHAQMTDEGIYKATLTATSLGVYRVEVNLLNDLLNCQLTEVNVVRKGTEGMSKTLLADNITLQSTPRLKTTTTDSESNNSTVWPTNRTEKCDSSAASRPGSGVKPVTSSYRPGNGARSANVPDRPGSGTRAVNGSERPRLSGRQRSPDPVTPHWRRPIDCPEIHFDESTQSCSCFLSDDKKTVANTQTCVARRRPTLTNRASIYHGVAGAVYFTAPCKSYFELDLIYKIYQDLKAGDVICDVMLTSEEMSEFVTPFRHHQMAISLSVVFCVKCGQVCIECWDQDRESAHASVGLSRTGTSLTLTLGFLIDDNTRSIKVVNVSAGEMLVTYSHVDFSRPIWPAFSVFCAEKLDARLALRTGKSISLVPRHLLAV